MLTRFDNLTGTHNKLTQTPLNYICTKIFFYFQVVADPGGRKGVGEGREVVVIVREMITMEISRGMHRVPHPPGVVGGARGGGVRLGGVLRVSARILFHPLSQKSRKNPPPMSR